MKTIAAVLGIALLAGCSDPISSAPGDLVGSWIETQPLSPRGTMDRILTFGGDGSFALRVDMYGLYPDQDANEVSGWSEQRGSYRVVEDRLYVELRTHTWWDSFYDDPGPFTSDAEASIFDDGTFEIQGDELVIRYLSYPADAPVETTMRLKRR